MSYNRGHCTGRKRERRRSAQERERLEAFAKHLTQQWAGKTPAELLALATGKAPRCPHG